VSFIRPEVLSGLLRWRDAIVGSVLVAFGLYSVFTGLTVQRWTGYLLILLGAALLWEGVKRARFPAPGGGPGVVEVDERQITYFGPLGGGAISINDLTRVQVRTTDLGPAVSDLFWDFIDTSGTVLTIPGDAENASLIFDALSALPGADFEAAIRAAGSTENALFVIWEKPVRRLH
jgi:hypothetical protein